jgi:hypothetical protein
VQKNPSYFMAYQVQHKNGNRNISLFKNLNAWERSRNCGVSLKGHSSLQCVKWFLQKFRILVSLYLGEGKNDYVHCKCGGLSLYEGKQWLQFME